MSDAVLGFTGNVAALVDEIVAKRKPRGEKFRNSSYPGLRHKTSARKYRDCAYVMQGFGRVRLLTAEEVEQFRAHVDSCIEARS